MYGDCGRREFNERGRKSKWVSGDGRARFKEVGVGESSTLQDVPYYFIAARDTS